MRTAIILSSKKSTIPKKLRANDNRYPEGLVKIFLNEYTKKGDSVFDHFAGLGTTLIVSEAMGRIPYGIELDKDRYNYIKSKLTNRKNIICGSSLRLKDNKFPKFDFSMTSPPYNPIDEENYLSGKGGYKGFIKDIGKIYSQLKRFMKKGSYIVIEVADVKKGKQLTPLPHDVTKEVSKIFHFEGKILVNWKNKKLDNRRINYSHSYCLVFNNK